MSVAIQVPQASSRLQSLSQTCDLVLGSSSPWRRQVLETSGVRVTATQSPDIDEKAIRDRNPHVLTLAIAHAKADALVARAGQAGSTLPPNSVLICSDQVSVCLGEIREKPESPQEARLFVQSYSAGHPVTTVSAVVLVNLKTGRRVYGHHEAVVQFAEIPSADIDEITKPDSVVYTCAGGFSVESPVMRKFVKSIQGGVDSVMGMPLGLLEQLLQQLLTQ